jgi:S-adenosylmethionine synthetase
MPIEIGSRRDVAELPFEIVERKGLGHPDTICDCLAERFSVALSRHYLDRFGLVLHHNVDKALLSAGRTEPAFGGGRILQPIDLALAGRATAEFRGASVPVAEIAEEAVRGWFRENLHDFDASRGLRLNCMTKPGSPDLVELFLRQRETGAPLANDTSIGVGYAPLSELERLALAVERHLNGPAFKQIHPETGEDIKVMGVRRRRRITLILSCAFIGRRLASLADYRRARDELADEVLRTARALTDCEISVRINAGDDIERGSVYLTVGGTSAECGDDGEVGRGNRVNGLITPLRPMTIEASAGKNPITHVGKLYNAAASRLAQRVVDELPEVTSCECFLVSEIGQPIHAPGYARLVVGTADGGLAWGVAARLKEIAEEQIAGITNLWREFLSDASP